MRTALSARRGAALAAALVASTFIAACQGDEAAEPAAVETAAEAGRVGAAGSACTLPVSFGVADKWKAGAVETAGVDPELTALFGKGRLTPVCELDGRPAGFIGFIRVYSGPAGDPRAVVTDILGEHGQDPVVTDIQAGGAPGVEIVFMSENPLGGELEPERAFVVSTGQGLVAVMLDSFDREEHDLIRPAYELVKSSLTVTG